MKTLKCNITLVGAETQIEIIKVVSKLDSKLIRGKKIKLFV